MSSFILHDQNVAPGVDLPLSLAGYPKRVGGFKTTYKRKEVIPLGEFVQPDKGFPFTVDRQRAEKWVNNFNLMKQRGHRVPLPVVHKEITPDEQMAAIKSGDNRGFNEKLEIGKNSRGTESIFTVMQLIGEDAELDAARNDVSISVKNNYKDCFGNVYDQAITHVCLTPQPVITGMDGPEDIAASRTDEPYTVFEFNRTNLAEGVSLDTPSTGDATMAKITPEQAAKLKKFLGDEVTEENGADLAISFLERTAPMKLSREQLDQAKQLTGVADLTDITAPAKVLEKGLSLSRELETVTAAKTTAETQALELSRKQPQPLGDELKVERSLRVGQAADSLVSVGYSPAQITALKPLLIGANGQLNELMLSRDAGAEDCRSMAIVQALRLNPPSPATGGTKLTEDQTLKLNRETGDGKNATLAEVANAVATGTIQKHYPGMKPAKSA